MSELLTGDKGFPIRGSPFSVLRKARTLSVGSPFFVEPAPASPHLPSAADVGHGALDIQSNVVESGRRRVY